MTNQKIIVVTGAKGLLGKAFATTLRERGNTVIEADIVCTNDLDNHQINIDITSETSVENCIAAILKKYNRIDGWVNNAYPRTADWGLPPDDVVFESWRKNVDMHMNGYYLCCQKIIAVMKAQKSGSIINMSSIYGMQAPDFTVYDGTPLTSAIAYSAIKGGIVNLTKFLASYYGKYNIRLNCISPGGIFDNQNPTFVKQYSHKTPLKRMGTPDDIAKPVAFLMSDDSCYITGHNLVVDGGWSIV